MHSHPIEAIAADASGRYAVTVSSDKTARIWDRASGQQLRVLRPPIDTAEEGKLFAVAMTPDGEAIAVAGFLIYGTSHNHVYVFERSSGRLLATLRYAMGLITGLSFSRDGNWLAGVSSSKGVQIWDWRRDGGQPDPALADIDAGASSRPTWSADSLAVAGLDGNIRLYRVDSNRLEKLAQAPAPSGRTPVSIAFSPDSREIAIGSSGAARVDIVDGRRLTLLHSPRVDGIDGTVDQVAWSVDGRTLYASGGSRLRNGLRPVRVWGDAGRAAPRDIGTVDSLIVQLESVADGVGRSGGVLVIGRHPAWGQIDTANNWHLKQAAPFADLRADPINLNILKLAEDGRDVQFGFERGGQSAYIFSLPTRSLQPASDSLRQARTEGLDIKNWAFSDHPTLRGQAVPLGESLFSSGLAIAPTNDKFVLATSRGLRCFDAQGRLVWINKTLGFTSAQAVNIPTSGRLVVAAYDDGTVRWHRISDGEELLRFFPHADRKRWILWTPSGYFDASPGGEELIGEHINRGIYQPADFFPAARLRDRFHRPDVIDQVLDTLDEAQAVAAADAARGRTTPSLASVVNALPPVVEIVSPSQVTTSTPQLTISYRARSAADAPVTSVLARVNGQALPVSRNLVPQAADGVREIRIDIPLRDSQVQLFAENRHGISTAATVQVKWAGVSPAQAVPATAGSAGFQIQPKLYVLAIGVGAYQHKDITKLSYAAKDARDFAQALQRQQGRLYRTVEVKVVTDDKADKDEIMDALDWLQKQVTQHDVGMLFLSGHGTNDASMGYVYLPVNADPDRLKRTAVTMADIRTTLNSVAGKAVAFLDTCHSGNVFGTGHKNFTDLAGVINELASAENGVVVFSSSTGRQFSLEKPEWSNGAFTKALIEGIDGKADAQRSGRVTFKMLDLYVTERVKMLTQGKQSPVTQAPGGVNDFPLALIKP